MTSSIVHTDHWLDSGQGRLFVRHWQPHTTAERLAPAPIVLFHDSLGCVELWRDFPERLCAATGRAVIAYDRLGFGRSCPHPGGWSRHFMQEEIERYFPLLCQALAIERFVVIGHSVGGAMAVTCAAQHHERCEALVTLSAITFVEAQTLTGVREAQQFFQHAAQQERLQRYHADKAPWTLAAWIDTWLDSTFADWSIEQQAAALACPLLAVHGAEDEYGTPRHAERLSALPGPASQTLILPDCGHFPHREHPEQVLEAIRVFLAPPGAPVA
ncbi:alpha/beta hydrolase [Pseudomonas sp. NW5]|uniref:alpha/beta fold hydrolase n=1 Tax=Pseudomonas sp. NW5 TaxID=2934934 RepID=UPI0020218379|nr:alpha/beta hydrolase [Pseudomonas sp. NW5]MCL7462598.1 alpha/beta hydrolase [Pseudomonas sp. NW5]